MRILTQPVAIGARTKAKAKTKKFYFRFRVSHNLKLK